MKSVLMRKFVGLGRDEDGAALVITLALFMFLYAACAGVFAIGQSVKDKIHLQNACDAAAYSAAVVQADTLSRIATVNRAMSWTYVSMTRRQMDYIVCKWLRHTYKHFSEDRNAAELWHALSPGCEIHALRPAGWFIGVDGALDKVKLNGTTRENYKTIGNACSDFVGRYLASYRDTFFGGGSADGLEGLGKQIDVDKQIIADMNDEERKLARALPGRVGDAANEVLKANINSKDAHDYRFRILQSNNVLAEFGEGGYLCDLHNNGRDESRFVRFGGDVTPAVDGHAVLWEGLAEHFVKNVFGEGIATWFVRDAPDSVGLKRTYSQTASALKSEWEWWSAKWTCDGLLGHVPTYLRTCPHVGFPECAECLAQDVCKRQGVGFRAVLKAEWLRDRRFDGACARPLILDKAYFGSAGTITVGLAKYNENPWTMVFRRVVGYMSDGDRSHGIYGLFNPYRYVEWSWAVSSAKAGYQYRDDDPKGEKRTYRVNYDDDDYVKWNLCTSDWDAVFVPVRQACAFAGSGRAWDSTGSEFLAGFVQGEWGLIGESSSAPAYNIAGNMPDLPLMHDGGGTYRNLRWSELGDLMFH